MDQTLNSTLILSNIILPWYLLILSLSYFWLTKLWELLILFFKRSREKNQDTVNALNFILHAKFQF
jgi:hypothetical protein